MMNDCKLLSKFVDKKTMKISKKVLQKMYPGQLVEAISVWKCLGTDDKILSQGCAVFRKATKDEAPKKLTRIQKIKVKGDSDVWIDEEEFPIFNPEKRKQYVDLVNHLVSRTVFDE